MDRRRFYTGQLVDEDDINPVMDYAYAGLGNLAADAGTFGIITGEEVTEQAVPDLTVKRVGELKSYNQAGERCYSGSDDTIDCEEDYLGNPTVPTGVGEKVWISSHIRFKYTESEPEIIKGETKFLNWLEGMEYRVVAGTPATGDTHTKPAKPSDALLLCDVELSYGDTAITESMIDMSRQDVFVYVAASGISVDDDSWSRIGTAANVQAAFDNVDGLVLKKDGSGHVDENLLWVDNSYDLGDATHRIKAAHLMTLTAYTSILAGADALPMGSATERFAPHFTTATIYTKLAAATLGVPIGDATTQFDAHLRNLTMYNSIKAASAGLTFGDATNPFVAFLSALTHYGTLAGTIQFNADQTVTVLVPITDFVSVGGTDWDWNSTRVDVECSVNAKSAHFYFRPLNGVKLDTVSIRWAQGSGTGAQAQVESVDADNSPGSIGSAKTMTVVDGSTNWDDIFTGGTTVADWATYGYRVKVTTQTDAVAAKVFKLRLSYKFADILKAALMRA